MNDIATGILDWSSTDSGGGSGAGGDGGDGSESVAGAAMPFRIDVIPEQPILNTPFYMEIFAVDNRDWNITHSGPPGGDNLSDSFLTGIQKTETIQLNNSSSINVEYPVGKVIQIIANSGVYDVSAGETLATPGSKLSVNLYSVINGEIIFTHSGGLYGALTITYETTGYKRQHLVGLRKGTHYFNCVGGFGRSEIKTIIIISADAGDGESGNTQPLSFSIRDYITDLPIAGAVLSIAGQLVTADSQGNMIVSGVDAGQTVAIKTTATGYHDSDVDTLDNDEVIT